MQETRTLAGCTYSPLDHHIHHMLFHDNSKQAVDEFFDALESALSRTPIDTHLLLIVDISQLGTTLPSLNYVRFRTRLLFSRLPERAPSRFVIIHNYGMMVSILRTFIKVMETRQSNQFNFFSLENQHEAIPWLLEQ